MDSLNPYDFFQLSLQLVEEVWKTNLKVLDSSLNLPPMRCIVCHTMQCVSAQICTRNASSTVSRATFNPWTQLHSQCRQNLSAKVHRFFACLGCIFFFFFFFNMFGLHFFFLTCLGCIFFLTCLGCIFFFFTCMGCSPWCQAIYTTTTRDYEYQSRQWSTELPPIWCNQIGMMSSLENCDV